jgi:hypothetical protein
MNLGFPRKPYLIAIFIHFTIFTICFLSDIHADSRKEFLCNFLAGNYTLIGGETGGSGTYRGDISITCKADHGMSVKRVIRGKSVNANGWIETVTADSIPVFKITFMESGRQVTGLYDICSTVGNNPRLTGYLKSGNGKDVFMEALFYQRDGVQDMPEKISDNVLDRFISGLNNWKHRGFLEKFRKDYIHNEDSVVEIQEDEHCYKVVVVYPSGGGWHACDAEFEIDKETGNIEMVSHSDPQPDIELAIEDH